MPENILTYNGISLPEEDAFGLPVRLYHHIFYGRVSQHFKVYGVHHKDAITDKEKNFVAGDLRLTPNSKVEYKNGFYEAAVACWNGTDWISKISKNGFFPDHWSHRMVMQEISQAKETLTIEDWQLPAPDQKKSNAYVAKLPSGQQVVFFLGSPRRSKPATLDKYIVTVFPFFGESILQSHI